MKKTLLAVTLLSAFSTSAFAEEREGAYIAVLGGTSSGIATGTTTTDSSSSLGLMLGFQVNEEFSIEAGYTSLVNKANLTYSAATMAMVSAAGATLSGTESLSGTEVAGLFNFPLSNLFSPFVRIGFANMTDTSESTLNGVTTTVDTKISGLTYGFGAQLNIGDVGVRIGFSAYNLKDSTGNTITPKNLYAGLAIGF